MTATYTFDIFFKRYLSRIERGLRLNADDWFADEPEDV